MNLGRAFNLIQDSISTFSLDLSGLAVLTEAATGYYMLTPLIGALAGADGVYVLSRDSRFGKAKDIYRETKQLARVWKVEDRIEILVDRSDSRIEKVDIVTNLGFVRPLDFLFLKQLKKTAVIPLMWETWEYRPEDLDLQACRRLGISVLGTNEHHPNLTTFEYIGYVAVKLLMEAGIEVLRSNIAVLGTGEFCEHTVRTLRALKARVTPLSSTFKDETSKRMAIRVLRGVDALVVVDHHNKEQLIGAGGQIGAAEISAANPSLAVIHICGGVDRSSLRREGIQCWPKRFAKPGYMSVRTDYVGPAPLINLHTAGLKVGEVLVRARRSGLSALEAEMKVLRELDIAQGFEGFHY